MPIYEYRCENGHHFDVMQKMTDGPVTQCEVCGAPVQRVFHPVAVHFKGSGFYNTDYGTAKRNRQSAASADSGADKHDAKQAEKKSETKPGLEQLVVVVLVDAGQVRLEPAQLHAERGAQGEPRRVARLALDDDHGHDVASARS